MSNQNARSEHYFLRPVAFSASNSQPPKPVKPSKRPRPAPIRTTGIRPTKIRNSEAYIENAKTPVSESSEATISISSSQLSPLSLALDTPRAIITAVPWKLRSRTTASEVATPSSAFSVSSESSESYQLSGFRLSPSPMAMESTSLPPSGRPQKLPFSLSSDSPSPYPYSPLLSAYENRSSPNPHRDLLLPRLDTKTQQHHNGLSTPVSARKMRTPVLKKRMRHRSERGAAAESPVEPSPVTPVGDEVEFPIILDPMTPPVNYTGETISLRLLPISSRESANTTRSRALKRGRASSRQDLTDEVIASPREEPQGDLVFLLPSSVFDPNQGSTASKASGTNELLVPNKRSRRQHNADLNGYERLMGRNW